MEMVLGINKNVFSKVEAFSIAHSQHIQEVNARGWKMNLSKLVVQAEVGDVEQWHFSGTLDPKDRPFDLNDMNFLAEAAFYIGAKRDGDQKSHFKANRGQRALISQAQLHFSCSFLEA